MLLTIVSRQYANFLSRIAHEAHVLVGRHHILCFPEVLIEVGSRTRFALALEGGHIDELESVREAGIRSQVLGGREHVAKILTGGFSDKR